MLRHARRSPKAPATISANQLKSAISVSANECDCVCTFIFRICFNFFSFASLAIAHSFRARLPECWWIGEHYVSDWRIFQCPVRSKISFTFMRTQRARTLPAARDWNWKKKNNRADPSVLCVCVRRKGVCGRACESFDGLAFLRVCVEISRRARPRNLANLDLWFMIIIRPKTFAPLSEKRHFSLAANVSQLNWNLFVRFKWMQHTAANKFVVFPSKNSRWDIRASHTGYHLPYLLHRISHSPGRP